jgi:hypothetical protein
MHLRRAQFTIRSLMIAVVIVAGLLALPDELRGVAAVLSLPCLGLFTAWRLLLGGHRRLAAKSLASVGLDVGHCPGGYARIDCLDRLAVSPQISDREIRLGACRG